MLTSRFEQAFQLAARLHARQTRKGKKTPYIAHLMAVAALVLEAGGNEDQAIAALLHDAVEDQGGQKTLTLIRDKFGDQVAEIVLACTDADRIPKPPWRARKEAYLAHLPGASPQARLVSIADKVHNARSILRDLRLEGEKTWRRFNGGKEGTLWYYRSLAEIFRQLDDNYLVDELLITVRELEKLASEA